MSYKRNYFKEDFNEQIWNLSTIDDLIMGYYLKKHQFWPICVKWDQETDFRVIDRIAFPVIEKISYSSNKKRKPIYQNIPEIIKNLLFDFDSPKGKETIF